jgi:colanic acid/amylovoran biosynthesis glycosyltransferase
MAECIIKLGCSPEKVKVHHLGVSVDTIEFKPRIWQPNTPLRVLIASTFTEKKGIPYALEALGKIQHQVPLEITIIGDAFSHPETQREKQKILTIVDKYNLKSKINFLGYQSHQVLFNEAYQHHIFLSPSVTSSDGDTEGGAPVSIIEMAATGMPIVSTIHCDIKEVILNGVTGLLAQERDIEGLVNHLQYLINHPEQWQPMLEKGRQRIELEYNAITQGSRLGNIYIEQAKNN